MSDFRIAAFSDEASPSIEGQIAALKRNGLRYMEIRHVDGEPIIDLPRERQLEIKKQLDENGISVWAIGSPIGKFPVDEDPAPHYERFQKTIETAQLFGTKVIRMFSFFIPEGAVAEDYTEEVLRRMKVLTDMAEAGGVACYHENESRIFGDVRSRVLTLHRNNPALKGVFDPANYLFCGEKPELIYDEIAPYIDYFHIKDVAIAEKTIVPAGAGDGHIGELLEKFRTPGVTKTLTVEPHLTVFSGLNKLQDLSAIHHRYQYESADVAFDTAVNALKQILEERGFDYE